MAASPNIAIAGDSVLATSLPSFGTTTVEATRPDAVTGVPVVIGVFSGNGNQFGPFSVNTTTPTPINPDGDCWQQGALSEALTPDLQPGDTVTVNQSPLFGGGGTSASVTVQPGDIGSDPGPIEGCDAIAPWAHNAITSGPSTVTGGGITVSGVAQPLATGVSVAASDGTHETPSVSATPASDGSWSATIPASDVANLSDTSLTVTPVFAVPDVSTGAGAHIDGAGLTVRKSAPAAGGSGQTGGGSSPTSTSAPTKTSPKSGSSARPRVTGLRVASTMTLTRARRNGINASFVVLAGVKDVRVELLRGKKQVFRKTVRAGRAGKRQTVVLRGKELSRLLRVTTYTVGVQAGRSSSSFGPLSTRRLRIG
jgi:hypothetical protein